MIKFFSIHKYIMINNYIYLILLLLLFLFAGFNKLTNLNNTAKSFQSKLLSKLQFNLKLEYCKYIIIFVALFQIINFFTILYSFIIKKYDITKYCIISLIIFTILATYLYHTPPCKEQYYHFMSNLSLIGSLGLMLDYLNKI